jgi:hypothetical protein
MPKSASRRRKKKKSCKDTAREKSARACAKHLADLKRAHGDPPPDVLLPSRSVVRLVSPVPDASWCTSPAQLCAELAE